MLTRKLMRTNATATYFKPHNQPKYKIPNQRSIRRRCKGYEGPILQIEPGTLDLLAIQNPKSKIQNPKSDTKDTYSKSNLERSPCQQSKIQNLKSKILMELL